MLDQESHSMTVSTTIPHADFGDPECGCLVTVVRDDLAVNPEGGWIASEVNHWAETRT